MLHVYDLVMTPIVRETQRSEPVEAGRLRAVLHPGDTFVTCGVRAVRLSSVNTGDRQIHWTRAE